MGEEYNESGNRLFTIYRAIINIKDQRTIAIVKLSVTPDHIAGFFANSSKYACVFDKNGNVFYVSDPAVMTGQVVDTLFAGIQANEEKTSFSIKIDGEKCLVAFDRSAMQEWVSVFIVPESEANRVILNMRNLFIIIGVCAVVVSVILVMPLIKTQTSALVKLVEQVSKVGGDSLDLRLDVNGSLEIANLVCGINAMLDRINNLVEQNYISSINEKGARLAALEAQLNPHFLYNTLQTISSKALLADNRDVSNMINALASTLRYIIKTDVMVCVSDELSHLDHYFLLQKARFEERLQINFHVEDRTLKKHIPKLFIQILAENSIKHGLEKTIGGISIDIRIYMENEYLIIRVSDDGAGISPPKLAAVRETVYNNDWDMSMNSGLGLLNIVGRLRLLYNGQASFELESNEGTGATSTIKIPYECV